MSRVGIHPVVVPTGVQVDVAGSNVTVSGKLGKQSHRLPPEIAATVKDGRIVLTPRDKTKEVRTKWGSARAHLNNMVAGVSKGFTINLEISGVGYRAQLDGKKLNLQLGFSHDVKYPIPEGISIKVGDKQTTLTITGADRQKVGQVAAEIRGLRQPEPYKGKGIKYDYETIRRKEGKKK